MSRLRLVLTIGADVAAPLMVAKVYRDASQDAYLVKFLKDGTKHRPAADYETDSLDDATGTAKHSVRRAYSASPADAIPPSARA